MRLIVKTAAAAVAVPLLITACSSASSTGSTGSTGSPSGQATAASASPTPADPNAGLFTGTQLKAMLEPASFFPSGFALDPSSSVNTGDTYQAPVPPGKLPCSRLDGTAWIDIADVGSVSFAQNDFIDKTISEEYAQEIDAYRGAGAKAVMASLRKVTGRCSRFEDTQTSSTVTVRLGKGPAIGDDSLSFALTDLRWQGGSTLEAVRIGTTVVTVFYSAANGTGAAQANVLVGLLAGRVLQKSL